MRRTAGGAIVAALLMAGCTNPATQVAEKEDLLAAAGFRWQTADSPQWLTAVNTLPPHRFTPRTVNGITTYYYADPAVCRCVYYGSEQAMADYRRMVTERRLVSETELNAYMDQAETRGSGGR